MFLGALTAFWTLLARRLCSGPSSPRRQVLAVGRMCLPLDFDLAIHMRRVESVQQEVRRAQDGHER